ncbi:MAG: hypothetical protein EHM93_20085 [Bacteroidales bacterium]|nr:MAG: hypothetical protein EHM93_20085 [Bacteroidales bacterium]
MKIKLLLLFTMFFFASSCHNPIQQDEQIDQPEIIDLRYYIFPKGELPGYGNEGPFLFFYYHIKNADWRECQIDGQWVVKGSIYTREYKGDYGPFPLQDYKNGEEIMFTVIIKNSLRTVTKSISYKF